MSVGRVVDELRSSVLALIVFARSMQFSDNILHKEKLMETAIQECERGQVTIRALQVDYWWSPNIGCLFYCINYAAGAWRVVIRIDRTEACHLWPFSGYLCRRTLFDIATCFVRSFSFIHMYFYWLYEMTSPTLSHTARKTSFSILYAENLESRAWSLGGRIVQLGN